MSRYDGLGVLFHYLAAQRRQRLRQRAALQAHQQRQWQAMRRWLVRASPFYAAYAKVPFEQWPVMDKARWMRHFDTINTAGIALPQAFDLAERAERSRDFRPGIGGVAVGLSTGTSGARGIFLASGAERRQWAGTLLAKLLPGGLFAPARVALLLRAGSNLYETVSGLRLEFRFIDLVQPFGDVLRQLDAFAPTILVGPSQVLALVAAARQSGGTRLDPARVISVAEVLDPVDRRLVEATWPVRVEQIYQATEGFLGQTCPHGVVHLNEENLIVEREWVDRPGRRFVPIITDLYRRTQPVIRYRLNDVLVERAVPCPCGSDHIALDRIEGREDDIVWLDGRDEGKPVPLCADSLVRTVLNAAGDVEDYQIDQVAPARLRIALAPAPDAGDRQRVRDAVSALCHTLGARPPTLEFCAVPARSLLDKQRRVRRLSEPGTRGHA